MADRDARKVDWPDEPGIFDVSDEELRAQDEARMAEVRAGRFISNEAVMRWLDEFIRTGKKGPRPQVGD